MSTIYLCCRRSEYVKKVVILPINCHFVYKLVYSHLSPLLLTEWAVWGAGSGRAAAYTAESAGGGEAEVGAGSPAGWGQGEGEGGEGGQRTSWGHSLSGHFTRTAVSSHCREVSHTTLFYPQFSCEKNTHTHLYLYLHRCMYIHTHCVLVHITNYTTIRIMKLTWYLWQCKASPMPLAHNAEIHVYVYIHVYKCSCVWVFRSCIILHRSALQESLSMLQSSVAGCMQLASLVDQTLSPPSTSSHPHHWHTPTAKYISYVYIYSCMYIQCIWCMQL